MKKQTAKKKTRSGIYNKGQNRVTEILEAAENLLIDEGYHNFSLRKVAGAAGIKLGNLQYYFPTKDDLVKAMLSKVILGYLYEFQALRASDGDDPKEQFKTVMRHVIYDLNNRRTTVFFPEVWSLSNHEEHVTYYMDAMYDQYRQIVAEIISLINPKLTPVHAKLAALFITSSLEGHTIFIGHEKPWIKETDHIAEMAIQSFLWLIEQGDIPK